MTNLSRRRFLAISAAAMAAGPARSAEMYRWEGVALGAKASITLAHPDARKIVAQARAEIDRLEGIFSLYRTESALTRLNREGRLDAPPFELLECLGQCGAVHAATNGRFDPTVQPLWSLYAKAAENGTTPGAPEVARTLASVGWRHVVLSTEAVSFARPGMALTLNGIAQGYIADRVAGLLRAQGLTNVLVNTGELRALGGRPEGGAWPVSLHDGAARLPGTVGLENRALASSAPLGTVVPAGTGIGHILDPVTGQSSPRTWKLVSVAAPQAAIADGLSTAGCLMTRQELETAVAAFAGAEVIHMA